MSYWLSNGSVRESRQIDMLAFLKQRHVTLLLSFADKIADDKMNAITDCVNNTELLFFDSILQSERSGFNVPA